ncbi:MAG: helix-turn-helix domain-containing protein [Thermoplasmata archaeon]|jgi:DNA-binding transcriptional ArsR family regulator|nr:helix-turn-helix domain-containing protein [Thermoplasmata archaeon]
MKDRKIIRDAGAFQLLADNTRMKMIYLLRAKEMTVRQIADELELTPQTIYHHIKRLRKADMVEVSREERTEHIVESFYRATAGYFHLVNGSRASECGGIEWLQGILRGLDNLGLDVNLSDKEASSILKLGEELKRHREDPDIVGKIYDMDDIDPSVGHDLGEFAMMMKMNEREFAKYLETQRTLRERLLSGRVDKEKP